MKVSTAPTMSNVSTFHPINTESSMNEWILNSDCCGEVMVVKWWWWMYCVYTSDGIITISSGWRSGGIGGKVGFVASDATDVVFAGVVTAAVLTAGRRR